MSTKLGKNIYGVQEVPETNVRSGVDQAVGISTDMANYSNIGNKILPGGYGAGIGAGVGLVKGAFEQRAGKRDEQIQYAHHITETINYHFFQYCNLHFLYSSSGYYV